MEKRFWKAVLLLGLAFHVIASFTMPLGLDATVHASYVSDGMSDGESHLEWGELRTDSGYESQPSEVSADGKWFAWHAFVEIIFSVFSISSTSLHIFGLIGGIGCLAVIYFFTNKLFGESNALMLTAISSIYPPLIRATGRFYQEGFILILITISCYAIIKTIRGESKIWLLLPVLSAIVILSFKGMPIWYLLPAGFVLALSQRLEMNQIQMALLAILVEIFILMRNGVSLTTPDIIPALLSSFIAYFLFVSCGMLLLDKVTGMQNETSIKFDKASRMIAACLIGWVSALWVTEAVSLNSSFFDIVYSFRNNPRYLSLLIVPLWYSRMLMSEYKFPVSSKPSNITYVLVFMLIAINSAVLATTGQTGVSVIGSHLEGQISDDDDILFISDEPLSMHRLYSLKFEADPESEIDNNGYWRTTNSGWQIELEECQELINVEWIIYYSDVNYQSPMGWVETEYDNSNSIDDSYKLFKWGGEDDRCS